MTFGPTESKGARITSLDEFNKCLDYFQQQGLCDQGHDVNWDLFRVCEVLKVRWRARTAGLLGGVAYTEQISIHIMPLIAQNPQPRVILGLMTFGPTECCECFLFSVDVNTGSINFVEPLLLEVIKAFVELEVAWTNSGHKMVPPSARLSQAGGRPWEIRAFPEECFLFSVDVNTGSINFVEPLLLEVIKAFVELVQW
jgi:hypothetical protein